MTDPHKNPTWSNRWTFILAATGAAVGLGNIWKFPYIAGEYGGGAFVLVYLLCILGVGIPVMIAEVLMGRKARENPVHATLKLSRSIDASKGWSLLGIMGVLAGIMILMFYSVVAGWSLEYVWQSFSGAHVGLSPEQIGVHFEVLRADQERQLIWHSIFLGMTIFIVGFGVTRGIGLAVEMLMPTLFVLLLILLVYATRIGDYASALQFLFEPDFSKLTTDAVLTALGHAFFTLSLGMGTVMVYGSYMPQNASIPSAVFTIAFLDTAIALVAGMTIFPLVFASGLEPASGPGLLFQSLPIAFSEMWNGALFGGAFFLLVTIAALSSSISLIEPGIAWLEKLGIRRVVATLGLGIICWLGGVASIFSEDVFTVLDDTTAKFMLPMGGLLIAVFVGWKLGYTRARKEIGGATLWFNLWFIVLRFVAPIGIMAVFANELHSLVVAKGWL